MIEDSLHDYLRQKNEYDRWFAKKYQVALKERYFKLLQDLNECAHTHWFCIDIEKMMKDVEDQEIDFLDICDIERMIVTDFHDSGEDIYEKLNASSLGEASYFLGSRMLRITEAVWRDEHGRRVDIRKAPRA